MSPEENKIAATSGEGLPGLLSAATLATCARQADSIPSQDGGGDHSSADGHHPRVPTTSGEIEIICAEIRAWHRKRVFAMDQRKRADLALGAFLRVQLGWSRDLPAAERSAIAKQAAQIIEACEAEAKGKPGVDGIDGWKPVILAAIASRAPFDMVEADATKNMERLAKSLPVWAPFGDGVRGFGARSLAVIVGEAGDLSNYANPAKLWKRMGLAVMDGVRQGGLKKTAGKDDWIAHGYSARRRSQMFVVGDCLVKSNGDGEYRRVYLDRKAYLVECARAEGKTVLPAAKIKTGGEPDKISEGHIHRSAQRYMEKRLLKNLWRAWRRAEAAVTSDEIVPAAELLQAAE